MPILCRISQIEAKGIEGYYDTNPLGDNNIMAKDEHQSFYKIRYKITRKIVNITTPCLGKFRMSQIHILSQFWRLLMR